MSGPTSEDVAELRAFNDQWLKAWTDKDIVQILAMYTDDCRFMDAATAQGLTGRTELRGYLEKMFPMMPQWEYRSDTLWPIEGGFCARWYCQMAGGRALRGFDLVLLRGDQIAYNEVYTHEI